MRAPIFDTRFHFGLINKQIAERIELHEELQGIDNNSRSREATAAWNSISINSMKKRRREGKGGPAEDGGEGAEVVGLDVIDGGLLRVHDVNGSFRGTLGHGERNRGDEDQDEKNRRWR